MYRLSDYSFDLPEDRIAQYPVPERDASRLLRLDRNTGATAHHRFRDLAGLIRQGDLFVINDTRVIPARLHGRKETGGRVEVFILDYQAGRRCFEETGVFRCECLIKASKRPKDNARIQLDNGAEALVESEQDGIFTLRFNSREPFCDLLRKTGSMPLPPYIQRTDGDSDRTDYQTVYAANEGAVAAPTAGLHFTETLMARLRETGAEFARLTLHVGYGTFVPVRVDDIREHQIHSEFYHLSEGSAEKINRARNEGRRVIAVGTTSVRTLEYAADNQGYVHPGSGMCDLFIYPGYHYRVVDAMITNFHLPESTLLMLVSAFAGRDAVLSAYREALASGYRFFSYGDAMFID